ncbi:hypothetical protein Tdes44962_MAKER09003 [Teratosphaeria destructans]|uniref:Uncharacterized protein n=1 Tax=Teratosphaeria destructans TaxID=418781 RepID=A0A9W7SUJ7_9PEZI|nr:hypothetical protein Tdes44962_MAKER09003 [Teratosphaeria destructans]
MADPCGILPFPVICIQCGTGKDTTTPSPLRGSHTHDLTPELFPDQNPCHVKVVGPTLGFVTGVVLAVVCWPASIFCGCCATEAGKKMLGAPADTSGQVSNCIPF